jgi:outer membrane protein insertion porin family
MPNTKLLLCVVCLSLSPIVAIAQNQPSTQPISAPLEQSVTFTGLEIRGNISLEVARIRESITQQLEQPLDEEKIRESIKNIYLLGGVTDVVVEIEDSGLLVFTISENPPIGQVFIRGELPFSGNTKRREKKVRAWLRFPMSDPLNYDLIKKNEGLLLEGLRKSGYHFATVTSSVTFTPPPEGAERGSAEVTFEIKAGPKVMISTISFSGNKSLETWELTPQMTTQPQRKLWRLSQLPLLRDRILRRGVFQERQLSDDLLRVQGRYLDEGYADVEVLAPTLTFNQDKTEVAISLQIVEGPQYQFGAVSFSGEGAKNPTELAQRAQVKPGETFRRSAISTDAASFSTELRDKGYANAGALPEPKKDQALRRVDINYNLTQGELVYISRIVIRGNRYTADKIIRRELKLAEGELYSDTKLKESRERLVNSGLFSEVAISSQRGAAPNQIELEVVVKDSRTSFSMGFGPNAEQAVLGSLRLNAFNLFGRGQTASLYYQGSDTQQVLNASFVEPRLFDTRLIAAAEVFFHSFAPSTATLSEEGVLPVLSWGEYGGGVEWAYKLKKDFYVYGGYSLSQRIKGILNVADDNLPEDLAFLGRVGALSLGLEFDSRDAAGFTTRGWYLVSEGSLAPGFLGSERPNLGGSLRATRFFRLLASRDQNPGGIIAKLSARGDGLLSLDGTDITYPDRLSIGAIGSVRGFTAQSLGPRIETTSGSLVIGGTSAASFTAELDLPLFPVFLPPWLRRVRGVAFLDAGNAFGGVEDAAVLVAAPQKDFGAIPLRMSVGAGLRWYISWLNAPVRVEVAQPLDPQGGERLRFHFTLGTAL